MIPFFSRRRRERELDEEIRTHLEMAVQERVARGESREEAERAVRREFGNEALVKEVTRTMWGGLWLDRLLQDLRFGVRSLAKDLGFAFVVILTFALGVGVTTAMFTVVNGVLFRPLPFFEPDRIVAVGMQAPEDVSRDLYVRDEHFIEIERRSRSFSRVATYTRYPLTLTGAGEAARMPGAFVTADFLEVLRVRPALGRGFARTDDQAGASPVVILGDALWRSRFGADPAVLGTAATLDGVSRTVIGVMTPDFDFPNGADLWVPLEAHPLRAEGPTFILPVIARLREDATAGQAREELSALAVASGWRLGSSGVVPVARVTPLRDLVVGDSRYPLAIFTGAVALVLLISCINVANLLLMRAGTREQEIGLRRVLGAGRPRLLRQLLTESVVVALLGGALGIVFAALGVEALVALAPPGTIPRGQEIGIDLVALSFTLAVSVLTGIGFGLAPALKATRRELRETVARGAHTHTRRGSFAGGALVVAELGVAVVLLTGAGLLLRSFQQVRAIDLGFQPENALIFSVDLPDDSYAELEPALAVHRRILDGLARIPGVQDVGSANFEPFGPLSMTTRVTLEDGPEGPSVAGLMVTSPGYFRAMGIPLLAGRGFSERDNESASNVVIVSRAMGLQLWPNRDPIGARLSLRRDEWRTVVAIAEDVALYDATAKRGPLIYLPLTQMEDARQLRHMSYVVRTAASVGAVASSMRAAVAEADPNVPAGMVASMNEVVLDSLGDRLFQTRALVVFAALAMLLAAVGVYGVTAYSVNERRRELGIRMALGAGAVQVARITLVQVLRLVVPGLLMGAAAATAATRFIAASLYEVAPGDPVTFVSVALLLAGVAIAAALVPARRATRVNPVVVLNG